MNDLKYMRLALAEATQSALDVPVGALVVSAEGRMLAKAHNIRERDNDPCGHAELVAIREVARETGNWKLFGCTLYVTLEPCAMCATAIVDVGLERVVFGAWDKRLGAAGSKYDILRDPIHNRSIEVVGGLLEMESRYLIKAFFNALRTQ